MPLHKEVTNHIQAAWALRRIGIEIIADTYEDGRPYWSAYYCDTGSCVGSFTEPGLILKLYEKRRIRQETQLPREVGLCGPPPQGYIRNNFDPWGRLNVSLPM